MHICHFQHWKKITGHRLLFMIRYTTRQAFWRKKRNFTLFQLPCSFLLFCVILAIGNHFPHCKSSPHNSFVNIKSDISPNMWYSRARQCMQENNYLKFHLSDCYVIPISILITISWNVMWLKKSHQFNHSVLILVTTDSKTTQLMMFHVYFIR